MQESILEAYWTKNMTKTKETTAFFDVRKIEVMEEFRRINAGKKERERFVRRIKNTLMGTSYSIKKIQELLIGLTVRPRVLALKNQRNPGEGETWKSYHQNSQQNFF